ncbi:hypothetical protein JANAI62_24990 [Jannaschia pagri]|uniref:DNA topoisomerase n=2 Tax=Roseobacteraceae TaxID=2854170 RepID=A0ABQ4NNA0_9RHOB|nr:hypothetical protein JANAI61_25000 [Jannaschia sp. AI_61]GIT95876.1 hypothetical protein JANAI62_24990 [Jannaschia sp. AI_62]
MTKQRLRALAVPPAYTSVWMSPHSEGYLLATGRDAAGRKQYRYHPRWMEHHAASKFDRLGALARALPRLRRWIAGHLAGKGMAEDDAIAIVLALMDRHSLRIGARRYTRENGSFGATTLQSRHLRVVGSQGKLSYRAKGGTPVTKRISGRNLTARLTDLKGSKRQTRLIRWYDARGVARPVDPKRAADRMADVGGEDITPKDFRTWNGSRAAYLVAAQEDVPPLSALATAAAEALHNTPAVARKSYIHPAILDAARAGTTSAWSVGPARSGLRVGEAELADLIADAAVE